MYTYSRTHTHVHILTYTYAYNEYLHEITKCNTKHYNNIYFKEKT